MANQRHRRRWTQTPGRVMLLTALLAAVAIVTLLILDQTAARRLAVQNPLITPRQVSNECPSTTEDETGVILAVDDERAAEAPPVSDPAPPGQPKPKDEAANEQDQYLHVFDSITSAALQNGNREIQANQELLDKFLSSCSEYAPSNLECKQAIPECPGCEKDGELKIQIPQLVKKEQFRQTQSYPQIQINELVDLGETGYYAGRFKIHTYGIRSIKGTCRYTQSCKRTIPPPWAEPGDQSCSSARAGVITERLTVRSSKAVKRPAGGREDLRRRQSEEELRPILRADLETTLKLCPGAEKNAEKLKNQNGDKLFACHKSCREDITTCVPEGKVTCGRIAIVSEPAGQSYKNYWLWGYDCFRACNCFKGCLPITTPSSTPSATPSGAASTSTSTRSATSYQRPAVSPSYSGICALFSRYGLKYPGC